MQLSAVQPFTLLDFPDRTACIAFTPGCNFRCGYCHNPEFVLPEKIRLMKDSFIDEKVFFRFLEKRKGLLDGVVVSGGEPTIMVGLPDFLRRIKQLGFQVKLDTNGSNPTMLRNMVEEGLLDYIAMDVKTSSARYRQLVGDRCIPHHIEESIEYIKSAGVPYEFRCTLIAEEHPESVRNDMKETLRGARKLFLQQFRPGVTLDESFQHCKPFSSSQMEEIAEDFRQVAGAVYIRT